MSRVPPDVPSLGEEYARLADYLRRFSLWSRKSVDEKIPIDTAVPSLLLLSPNGTTYRLAVSDAGVISTTLVPAGSNR